MQNYIQKEERPFRSLSYISVSKPDLLDGVLKLFVGNDLLCEHVSTGLG